MADDDSFLTDSDDERAVEDLLSQAKDHSVLEQIAAINCSSFSNSDNLPFDLENRFRKLKSLPTTTTVTSGAGHRLPPSKSKSFTPQSSAESNSNERKPAPSDFVEFEHDLDLQKGSEKSSPSTDSPEEHSRSKLKPKSASNTDEICKPNGLKSKSKPRTVSSESRSDSWSLSSPESESRSVSPPAGRGIGCLWCSPKKEKKKQGKENRLSSSSSWGNDYDVEFLKTFSVKEQKRIMKQAMKEEEKINKEAEKIVKWAKQASSRMMNVSGLDDDDDDELTDVENTR